MDDVTIVLANHHNVDGGAVARAMDEILGLPIDSAVRYMAEAHADGAAYVTAMTTEDAELALAQLNELSGAQCWYMDDVPTAHDPDSEAVRDMAWANANQALYSEMRNAAQRYAREQAAT
jgi:hypothetical protein